MYARTPYSPAAVERLPNPNQKSYHLIVRSCKVDEDGRYFLFTRISAIKQPDWLFYKLKLFTKCNKLELN